MALQWRSTTQEGIDSPNYPTTDWVLFPSALTYGGARVLAEAIEEWLTEQQTIRDICNRRREFQGDYYENNRNCYESDRNC